MDRLVFPRCHSSQMGGGRAPEALLLAALGKENTQLPGGNWVLRNES